MGAHLEHIPRKVLSSLDVESLAAAVNLRGRDDPGMRFARLGIQGSEGKHEARLRVRNAMLGEDLRSFLTMPGLYFAFEWMLLEKRESRRVLRRDRPRRPERTYITAIEREPEIYRAAIRYMPGRAQGYFKTLEPIDGARHSMMNSHITRYHQITLERYAEHGRRQDAAFLDFCGPLTSRRCRAIAKLWSTSETRVLAVCWMNGRYEAGWNCERAFKRLLFSCPSAVTVDDFSYGQFRQVILRRIATPSPPSGATP
jgi:hypothetical protein